MRGEIPLIIGHRGCKYPGIRENSLEAVIRAIEEKADIVEIDVARTADGEFVAFHYPNWNPFAQRPRRRRRRELPHLDDVSTLLQAIGGRVPVYLDIKDRLCSEDVLRLVRLVEGMHKNSVIVGSFFTDVLERFKKAAPDWVINYHCVAVSGSLRRAVNLGASWINPMPFLVTEKFVRGAMSCGLKFVPGGNECERRQLHYARLGAYALSTFRPARLRVLLEGRRA
jgi:glycerophosphoryl diester phosphodiesterase